MPRKISNPRSAGDPACPATPSHTRPFASRPPHPPPAHMGCGFHEHRAGGGNAGWAGATISRPSPKNAHARRLGNSTCVLNGLVKLLAKSKEHHLPLWQGDDWMESLIILAHHQWTWNIRDDKRAAMLSLHTGTAMHYLALTSDNHQSRLTFNRACVYFGIMDSARFGEGDRPNPMICRFPWPWQAAARPSP